MPKMQVSVIFLKPFSFNWQMELPDDFLQRPEEEQSELVHQMGLDSIMAQTAEEFKKMMMDHTQVSVKARVIE